MTGGMRSSSIRGGVFSIFYPIVAACAVSVQHWPIVQWQRCYDDAISYGTLLAYNLYHSVLEPGLIARIFAELQSAQASANRCHD